jgi:2-phospho-L-lactate guanylyltransferase
MLDSVRFLARSEAMPKVSPASFSVLVPVKPAAIAKSRLAPVGDEARRKLVGAFAADTVAAALAAPHVGAVMVVTDDHVLAATLRRLGAHVLPDATTDDLNESLSQAAAEARRRWPEQGLAVVCADLPALDPAQLGQALEVAAGFSSAFVADAEGEGTTMVAAASGEHFTPRFGRGSRDAHVVEGAHEIVEVDVPTLRRDVDTPADLAAALELGVGVHTAGATRGLSL